MIRLQEMLVSEIVGKSMIKEETLRDYISGKAEWYIPATEAITLKLADKYSVARLENACVKALQFTPQPSYKSIQNILVTGQDKLETAPAEKKPVNNEYGFTRGAKYYGRK